MSEKKDRKRVAMWLFDRGLTADAAARVAAAFPADYVAAMKPKLELRRRHRLAGERLARRAVEEHDAANRAAESLAPYWQRAERILAAMQDEAEGGAK